MPVKYGIPLMVILGLVRVATTLSHTVMAACRVMTPSTCLPSRVSLAVGLLIIAIPGGEADPLYGSSGGQAGYAVRRGQMAY